MPRILAAFTAGVADGLSLLGWRSPLRSSAVAHLSSAVRGDSSASMRQLGVRMRGLTEILALAPSGVQERWFARLYLLKPPCLLALALVWAVAGLAGLSHRSADELILVRGGASPGLAAAASWAIPLIEVGIGLLICWRRTVRPALFGVLAMCPSYLLTSAVWRPDFWSDPLAPLIRMIPCAILALVALAILDEH
jgi:hypothetical protein